LHQRQIKIPIYAAVSRSVLIADDSPSMSRSVQFLLERHRTELRIGEAVDGVDAIEKARGSKPDLILLDLAMPRLNGVEAASILKRILPKTPIILFTMHTDVHADSLSAFINVDFVSKVDGSCVCWNVSTPCSRQLPRAPEQRLRISCPRFARCVAQKISLFLSPHCRAKLCSSSNRPMARHCRQG